ncbi:TPA: hypothetical protein N0F65_001619 [Lagenidium giganteum]|uniref:holo-[acyl-carrier-protein] synthase n=1 Tax=Lagenidium giganteum TaxID=4803 RepID=A0AAV2YJJ8_9STRA|nr:TPA: hypothetical protein N0F65_001619 [Lagenidium giganteum]
MLPPDEQNQVQRFMFVKDQRLALASRLLQRAAVHHCFHVPLPNIVIERTPERKPFWRRRAQDYNGDDDAAAAAALRVWNYNVSHHGTIVALASSASHLVGVDVVRIADRPRRGSAAEFFRAFEGHFNASEWQIIRHAADDDEDAQYAAFYRLWSLKEAYIKAIGIGLGFQLLRAEFFQDEDGDATRWKMRLDGGIAEEWSFESTQVDAEHVVSVACGPLSAIWNPATGSVYADGVVVDNKLSHQGHARGDGSCLLWQSRDWACLFETVADSFDAGATG